MKDNNLYTLITGASTGIGRAFAIENAKRGYNLALVSLPNSGLDTVIKYIKKHYPITVKYYLIDLTEDDASQKIYDWTREEDITVNILINNAGKGHLGDFLDYESEFYKDLIRLNIESVVLLTRLFLPEMKKLQAAYILNLGSIASYYPMPYKIVYAGSKMFVYSFSRALKEELRHSGVHVSVLCPGPIITSREVIERIRQGGFWGRISSMRAQTLAKLAMDKLFKKKTVIIPGLISKFFILSNRLLSTSFKQKIISRKFRVKKNGDEMAENEKISSHIKT
jgi:hypothetical protein